ncbi:unnamed protein product [Nyctereutes procyonoides]|uniref:(raccoon dog) hypothetical protein n=1 Tax=Nyctereutes procyonoides TaxID=34880 RepID=A0A811ZBW3_NYCPR|nr:unnamed protein product [Nyctereutes procyonoides]
MASFLPPCSQESKTGHQQLYGSQENSARESHSCHTCSNGDGLIQKRGLSVCHQDLHPGERMVKGCRLQ